MWLYYWLAAAGINPMRDTSLVTVPPPQMVAHLRRGRVDGFSAGDPWNQGAVLDGAGICAATSQQIWKNHPEKVLGCTATFAERHPNTARAVGRPNYMKLLQRRCGDLSVPHAHGMWFLTQHKRWGGHPDYLAVAKQINQTELYKQAAAQLKVSVPKSDLRASKLVDGVLWRQERRECRQLQDQRRDGGRRAR